MKTRRMPLFLLLFLPPMIAELLTASSPPAEFFIPFAFVVLVGLYGGGAILARELIVRWRKGWPSLLALGAAYGILEEGLIVKSFTNPDHVDLGILGQYGRWGGVNWVWAVELTMFHAVFSIIVPLLLTQAIFPEQQGKSWVGRRGLILLVLLLVALTLLGFFGFPSRPPLLPYALWLVAVPGLTLLARWLPAQPFAQRAVQVPRAIHFWLLGLLGTLAFFIIFWAVPYSSIHPLLTILLGLALAAAVLVRWLRMSGDGVYWRDAHRLALATGGLFFYILLAPLREFDQTRPDNTRGMTAVGVAMLLFLVWAALRVKRRVRSRATQPGGGTPS